MHIVFWLENLQGQDHLEELCIDGSYVRTGLREIEWEVGD